MKKRRLFVFCIALALLAAPARGAEREYTVGVYSPDEYVMSQYKTIFDDIFKAMSKNGGIKLRNRVFLNHAEFDDALNKKSLDFFLQDFFSTIWKEINGGRYIPFAAISIFGSNTDRLCAYVRPDSTAKEVKDIAGAHVATYDGDFEYFMLRRLIGERPEKFFGSLTVGPNAVSNLYMLAMGQADVSFSSEHLINFMRVTNPGPVKKIRPVVCSDSYVTSPAFFSKKTPPEVVEQLKNNLFNLLAFPEIKKYRPLIDMVSFRVVPAGPDDYKNVVGLYKEALKKGWDKDFEQWIKFAKPKSAAQGTEKTKP